MLNHHLSKKFKVIEKSEFNNLINTSTFCIRKEIHPSKFFEFWILYIAGSVLCVGSEWHRFPSSFLVPDYVGEVRWIDDGFRGLLPFPFNSTLGGTAAAPPYFNDKNKAADGQYVINSS
jgi:hypothetical protein